MRKILTILLLTLIASTACATNFIHPSPDDGELYNLSGGYWVWRSASAPPPVSTIILEYLMGANGSESTITLDTSGNDLTGTVSSASWQVATNGIDNNYLFTGTEKIEEATVDALTSITGQLTCEAWVKKSGSGASTPTYEAVMAKGGLTVANPYSFGVRGAGANDIKIYGYWYNASTLYGAEIPSSIPDDQLWHYLVFTRDSNADAVYYVDGKQVGTDGSNADATDEGNAMTVGWGNDTGATESGFKGNIARPSLSDTNISAGVVFTNYVQQGATLGGWANWYSSHVSVARDDVAYHATMFDLTIQDFSTNHTATTSGDAPAWVGNLTNAWGVGNGVSDVIEIIPVATNAIVYWAGTNAATVTNFAYIGSTQYVNGVAEAFANTHFYSSGSTYYFYKSATNVFYTGIIDEITFGESGWGSDDLTSYYNDAKTKLGWTD